MGGKNYCNRIFPLLGTEVPTFCYCVIIFSIHFVPDTLPEELIVSKGLFLSRSPFVVYHLFFRKEMDCYQIFVSVRNGKNFKSFLSLGKCFAAEAAGGSLYLRPLGCLLFTSSLVEGSEITGK